MTSPSSWRVGVTRDGTRGDALSAALTSAGLVPVSCPVLVEAPAADSRALVEAAARLHEYAWVVVASTRAVTALMGARTARWPRGVRTAAVGAVTARALLAAGADPAPLVGAGDGAAALWQVLRTASAWRGTRVLVPTTPGGKTLLIDALRGAGAHVDAVEAYRMTPRAVDDIRADWRRAAADAVVVASPRAAATLAEAVGRDALSGLRCVVAIGDSTAAALRAVDVRCVVPATADVAAVVRLLIEVSRAEVAR